METSLYYWSAGLFAGLVVVLFAALLLGVRQATAASPEPARRTVLRWTAAGLLLWLGLTAALALSGFVADFEARPPRLVLLLPLPLLVAIWLAASRPVGRLLDALSPAGLVYWQGFRVLMEVILWLLFLAGVLPRQMTFEGLNWDVLTGLTAPVVAYFCFVRRSWPWQVALGWNVLGLALLLNIVVVALLSAPLPIRQFWNEPANTVVAHFPFIWLPTFVVPVAYTLHILSIRQLLRQRAARHGFTGPLLPQA